MQLQGQDLAETAVKESGPILDKTKELLEAASSAAEDFAEDPIMKSHFCKCQHQVCQCCSDIVYKRFGLNDVVCVNAEYYPSEPAVSANVSWDGKVIISDTLSARNPPDVCAEVPIPKLTVSFLLFFQFRFPVFFYPVHDVIPVTTFILVSGNKSDLGKAILSG